MGWLDFVKNNAGTIIGGAGAIYGAVKGNQAQNQANAMGERQMQQVEREYRDRQGLRDAGTSGLLNVGNPYSAQMENVGFDQTNPFARDRGRVALNTATPASRGMASSSSAPITPYGEPMSNPNTGRPQQSNPLIQNPGAVPEGDATGWHIDPTTGRWTRR